MVDLLGTRLLSPFYLFKCFVENHVRLLDFENILFHLCKGGGNCSKESFCVSYVDQREDNKIDLLLRMCKMFV